jgi:hypothetical protein
MTNLKRLQKWAIVGCLGLASCASYQRTDLYFGRDIRRRSFGRRSFGRRSFRRRRNCKRAAMEKFQRQRHQQLFPRRLHGMGCQRPLERYRYQANDHRANQSRDFFWQENAGKKRRSRQHRATLPAPVPPAKRAADRYEIQSEVYQQGTLSDQADTAHCWHNFYPYPMHGINH